MKESQFGFEYSWADLKRVPALTITLFGFQFLGALLSLYVAHYAGWFENLWAGGAIATLPGFLTGLLVQSIRDPAALAANMVMVRRMGLVAALLFLAVLVMPLS